MSLGNALKKSWMWIVGAAAATGGAVWGVIAWMGAAVVAGGGGTGGTVAVTTVAAAFVLSFSDKGWLDQFQEPVDEAFVLADQSRPDEATKILDDIDGQIDAYVEAISNGTAEANDPEKAASNAARADAVWAMVRETITYQTSGDQDQWLGQLTQLLTQHPDAGIVMALGLQLVGDRISEDDLTALLRGDFSTEARGSVVGKLIGRCQSNDRVATPEDARFLEDVLLEVYETSQGAAVVAEYVKVQDALGQGTAANAVLETMMQLTPNSATGAAAAKARVRNAADDADLVIRLYEQYPETQAGEALQPLYVRVLVAEGRTTEAIQVLLSEGWEGRHEDPAGVAKLVYSRARTIASTGSQGNPEGAGFSAVDICVSLSERLLIEGEIGFSTALLIEVLEQGQALPLNQMTRQPLRDPSLMGDMANDDESVRIAEYFLGLVQIRQERWDEARGLLEQVAGDSKASLMTQAHAWFALAQGHEAAENLDEAVASITAASNALPNSLMLRESLREYESRRVEAEILASLEIQIGEIRSKAEDAATPQEAVEHYRAIAQLYLASGFGEQAIGVLVQASETYADHDSAPELLREAIQILTDYQLDNSAARVRVLEQRLELEYASSNE